MILRELCYSYFATVLLLVYYSSLLEEKINKIASTEIFLGFSAVWHVGLAPPAALLESLSSSTSPSARIWAAAQEERRPFPPAAGPPLELLVVWPVTSLISCPAVFGYDPYSRRNGDKRGSIHFFRFLL